MDKSMAEICREHARYYRKIAELIGNPAAAEMYQLLAQAFELEAEEAEHEDPSDQLAGPF
jgi:hypothetical protein